MKNAAKDEPAESANIEKPKLDKYFLVSALVRKPVAGLGKNLYFDAMVSPFKT